MNFKRIFPVIALLLLLLTTMVFGQSTGYIRSAGKTPHDATFQKVYCITEGDYVINTASTDADTSAVYVLNSPRSWQEIWVWSKPSMSAASDSIALVMYYDIKSDLSFNSAAANDGLGWVVADSSLLATADTLGGVYKKLTIPAGTSRIRVRQVGVGDNAVTATVVRNETWITFKE